MMFHHDPLHSDEYPRRARATARAAWTELGGDATQLELGMEGAELDVGPAAVPPVHA